MLRAMNSTQIVPIVSTSRMAETRHFYQELLGCQVSFDHTHYLGIRAGAAGAAELGFMLPDADEPAEFAGQGLWFGFAVADADAECARLQKLGVAIKEPLADMPWGCRRFTVVDPNGVVVMINHPIPAAVEFADCIR